MNILYDAIYDEKTGNIIKVKFFKEDDNGQLVEFFVPKTFIRIVESEVRYYIKNVILKLI